MSSIWQQISLSTLPVSQWRKGSYVHRLIGLLQTWHEGSWLFNWSESIGALLISIVLIAAPFSSTTLIGVLLIACGGYWLLLTLADQKKGGFTPIQ